MSDKATTPARKEEMAGTLAKIASNLCHGEAEVSDLVEQALSQGLEPSKSCRAVLSPVWTM